MDQDLDQRIQALEQKIDAIHRSVEKTRKYLMWTFIVSIVVIVLPLIGMVFVIPMFMKSLTAFQGV